jgi:protein FAM50
MANQTTTYNNTRLFTHSADPTPATPVRLLKGSPSGTTTPTSESSHLKTAEQRRDELLANPSIPDSELEGSTEDPSMTKVVDRRWYERNKHIYPASVWEEYDPKKDYSNNTRKDGQGNNYFFSR